MRTGRGSEVNDGLIRYVVQCTMQTVMKEALETAVFFAEATGRSKATAKDVKYALMFTIKELVAADTFPDRVRESMQNPPDDFSEASDSSSEESSSEPEEFHSILLPDLTEADRKKASRIKQAAMSWDSFQPQDPLAAALKMAVDNVADITSSDSEQSLQE